MKRKALSILLTFAMILLLLPNAAVTSAVADNIPWKGSGTENDPYLISSREEFDAIADAVNSGNDLLGVYFKQTDNIDFGDEEWPTVGITINNAAHQFRGVFDGGDNNIYNLCVNRGDDDAGLFGFVGEGGVIRNVHVVEGEVIGTYWVGGIVGRNYGIVEYCSFSGYVYGNQQYIGGIVGDNHGGTVRYCYNLGDVEFNQIGGGVVGRNSGGTVENCYNRGDVYSDNIVRGYAGGVVGENTAGSTVENCYSDGWVESKGDMACGAIVGANGEGSTVKNCYYPEEFEDEGLQGVGGINGTIENVTPKSKEQFDSGEVTWELSQGTNGEGWGQTLNDDDGNHDEHPHFTDAPDKEYPTTPIYRVSFKANDASLLPPDGFKAVYVDPGEKVDAPPLPPSAAWYVKGGYNGEEYDGAKIEKDIDAFAGKRILFAGEDGTIEHSITYSTEDQTFDLDLYMKYAEGGPYSEGKFEYTLTEDADGLNAKISDDRKTLIIPAGKSATDSGYTLKFTAHEKEPFIMPIALGQFGTDDVGLTVHITVEKATPEIIEKPTVAEIDYGTALSGSTLSGGKAVHPTARTGVDGGFAWDSSGTVPTVNEAAIAGYSVTFIPDDKTNYNTVTTTVTVTVNKVPIPPEVITKPTPKTEKYNGMAENLINEGKAQYGTMKYWLADEPNDDPPDDNSAYSSTVPSRTNVGTYTIWYKVIGDENHTDTEPQSVTAEITPFPLTISEHVTYNGGSTFTLGLKGVTAYEEDRTVIAYVTTSDMNADSYVYSDTPGSGKFTAELSNSNYIIDKDAENILIIDPLPVVLKWKGRLTFVEDGGEHSVEAEVINGLNGDTFALEYEENADEKITHTATIEGGYTARVSATGNANYTADPEKGAQNVSQPWRIFKESDNITLTADPDCTKEEDPITYGGRLTLTAEIVKPVDGSDTVEFFVNNVSLGTAAIEQIGGKNIAVFTISDATDDFFFSLGSNAVRAEYKAGDSEDDEQVDAVTVYVDPKPIHAKFGNTEKVYDGNNVAVGLVIEVDPTDIENNDDVSVTADNCTYNDANAADNKTITARNVTLSGAQSGNYTIAGELTASGKITPKTIKLEWRGSTGLVYTGNRANVYATATEMLPDDKCEVTVTGGDSIKAGKYTANAVGVSNANYQLPNDNTVSQSYEIKKADLYIGAQERPYNGTNRFDVSVDGVTPANENSPEKVAVELTASSNDAGDYTYSAEDAEVSAYTPSTADTNYNIAGGGILTILKVDPTYKAPVPLELPYTGQPQDLVTEGTADGGDMLYSFSEDGTYYAEEPTGIDEGTYTIWYKVVGDINHNDIAPRSVNAVISKNADNDNTSGGGTDTSDTPPVSDSVDANTPSIPPVSGSGTADRPDDPDVSGSGTTDRTDGSDVSGSGSSDRPDSSDVSGGDTTSEPNGSVGSDGSDTTKLPDSSQSSGKAPNTGIEINFALYFFIICVCGTAITVIFRHSKQ